MWLGALWWCLFCPMDPRRFFYIYWYKSWSSSGRYLIIIISLILEILVYSSMYVFWWLSLRIKRAFLFAFMVLLQIWDGTQCKKVRTMGGHQTRTGVLAWNSRILASGSRDRNILQHDMRVSSDFVNKLVGHKSEVFI